MVAMLAFGGTFAYFTANAGNKSGSIKTGTIKLTSEATAITLTGNTSALLPGESVSSSVTYKDESDRGTYVFFKIDTTSLPADQFELTEVKIGSETLTKSTETDYTDVYVYENSQANTGADKETRSDVVKSAELVVSFKVTFKAETPNGTDDANMGKTYTVTISSCSVQHAELTVAQALAASAFKA